MGYEDKLNTVYNNLESIPDISYDNIEDILDMLVEMSSYIKMLESRIFELEVENK